MARLDSEFEFSVNCARAPGILVAQVIAKPSDARRARARAWRAERTNEIHPRVAQQQYFVACGATTRPGRVRRRDARREN